MKNQRNGSYGEMRSGGMALAGSRSQCGSNQRHPAYVSASKRKMKAYEEKKRKTNGVKCQYSGAKACNGVMAKIILAKMA
jgi:hypothetical protein